MNECGLCEKQIEHGILYGFWENGKSKPLCFKCLRRLLDSDGKDIGLKERIEKWLTNENYDFTIVNEPTNYFHFMLNDVGPLKMAIEIFQENEKPFLFIGFMTFLSKELMDKVIKMNESEKQNFKNKIDDFLATLRIDYREGFRVGYELISDKGHYGAKYFLKSKVNDCTRDSFFKMLDNVKNAGKKADSFLHSELLT